MTPHQAARSLVRALKDRQDQLGLSNKHLRDRYGLCDHDLSNWRSNDRLPRITSLTAWAAALGMEVVLRERSSD